MTRPTIRQGDVGPDVKDLLNLLPTYYFDAALTNAVMDYQRSRGLDVDGIVGPNTWAALESDAPPYVPPGLPPMLPSDVQAEVERIAINSPIASYSWKNRGRAPSGYTKGVALAFANTYRQWRVGYSPAINMARANTHNSGKDVFSWYDGIFIENGMDNSIAGADSLRHLWALILGLGMRESSGKHCCGRDQSASNTSSDTCEAGAWQTSYNAHSCSSDFDVLFEAFKANSGNPQGFEDTFAENVSCGSSDWQCYGSGNGYLFQKMSKEQPAFAAEACGITLRNLRQHYGPINRYEAEVKPEADAMLQSVQSYIDDVEAVA